MKKNFLLFYLFILLILIIISRTLLTKTTTQKKENTSIKEQLKKFSFYKKENLTRYISYHKQNKNLSIKQIITNVNIGLDKPFYTNTKETITKSIFLLVNKYNYLNQDYIPDNLEQINPKYTSTSLKLVKEAKQSFEELSKKALQENLNIIAMSTYRSYSYQKNLYNNYVKKDGIIKADTYSARPGHSEHQTGLAVDVYNKKLSYTEFENTKEFIWMQKNAHKYGFILRYPKNKEHITGYQYESWHYRYVGKEIATFIHKNNLTYDEYYIQYLDKDQNTNI